MSLILQPFRRFTYVTAHSTALPLLHLRHSSFSNPSAASSTSELILQLFRRFTYVTGLPQPFRCFTYATGTSRTYFTWRADHAQGDEKTVCGGLACYSSRSSYSFGQLLRIILRAANLFSFSHIVSSDSSFNNHNSLYFVKQTSRAAQNLPEGRRRHAGRGLKTPDLNYYLHLSYTYKII